MAKFIEKRSCRRFFIPGATMTFRHKRWFRFSKRIVGPVSVADISKGGLSFLCLETLRKRDTILIRLEIPGEKAMDILGSVAWHSKSMHSIINTGVNFMPFTDEKYTNPTWILDVLRRMDSQYSSDSNKTGALFISPKKPSEIKLDDIIF